MRSQVERAAAFRALHEGPPFVVPNPWEVGSARVLEAMGFQALATTSSGFAFTLGPRPRMSGGERSCRRDPRWSHLRRGRRDGRRGDRHP